MADLEFTDTHVHFWDLNNPQLTYKWLQPGAQDEDLGDYEAIKSSRYWADDFIAETRFHNVTRAIHVQAAVGIDDPVRETSWLQEFADRLDVPHGIVASLDLASPTAAATLERHLEFGNLRGIRDLRYDGYLSDESWRQGFALLERPGLVCCDDPLIEHMQDAAALAASYPGITYCIDHAGYPRRRDRQYFDTWREGMAALADVESTVVKISGLGMCDHRWTVDSLRPWVLTCIELWGAERAFFGTNWPVDRLYSSYGDVVNAYREIIDDFASHEREALLSRNANRVFGLLREQAS